MLTTAQSASKNTLYHIIGYVASRQEVDLPKKKDNLPSDVAKMKELQSLEQLEYLTDRLINLRENCRGIS